MKTLTGLLLFGLLTLSSEADASLLDELHMKLQRGFMATAAPSYKLIELAPDTGGQVFISPSPNKYIGPGIPANPPKEFHVVAVLPNGDIHGQMVIQPDCQTEKMYVYAPDKDGVLKAVAWGEPMDQRFESVLCETDYTKQVEAAIKQLKE